MADCCCAANECSALHLRTIRPRPEIAPWIHHFWVFESGIGLPETDARIVVPNGRPKLVIPWRNALVAKGAGQVQRSPTGEIVLIGVWDQPSILSSPREHTVTIGVEFRPNGLSRFFAADLDAVFQRIVPVDQALGAAGVRFTNRVNAAAHLAEAVEVVQAFLVERLHAVGRERHGLVDEAIGLMGQYGYAAGIADLAMTLGCSRRHLQDLFRQQVGVSPKRLPSILAFEGLYRKFSQDKDARLLREEALDIWFDQSHFTRAFRQFTGHAPGRFAELDNEFGRIFYR